MFLLAPAKINLTLRILSKRPDGYHEISSLMRAIRLFDELAVTISFAEDGVIQEPVIRVSADAPGVPDGPGNLAYRAAALALETWGCSAKSGLDGRVRFIRYVGIGLKKNIPMAAGLAGGSADAAAVLLGLSKELNPAATLSELAALGAALGADVPFCVYSCAASNPVFGFEGAVAALVGGAGELITPRSNPGRAQVVLVKPSMEIRASEAYALYDTMVARGVSSRGSDNDLEAPCARAWPIVAETLEKLKNICAEAGAGGAKVQLSGSGPTVFAYFEEKPSEKSGETAARVYDLAKTAFHGMFVHLTDLC